MVEVVDGLRLPRISASGWMPWIAYSRRFDPNGPAARVGAADDQSRRRRGADEPRHRGAAAGGEPRLPGRHARPAALAAARPRAWPRMLSDAAGRGPAGPAERGIRPIEGSAEPAENLRRLRTAMSRGEDCLGFVVPGPSMSVAVRPDRAAAGEGARRPRPGADRDQPQRRHGDVPPHRRARRRLCAQFDRARLQAGRPGQHRRQPRAAGRLGERAAARQGGAARFRRAAARQRRDRRHRRLAQAAGAPERRGAGADHRPFRMPRGLHDAPARQPAQLKP